ncbi:MAG: flagellar basal-body rod protein [Geobacteraceae bacterium]|nr:MAG: flagellar basal-body rod protein [Geobacteraceae bacterium]
MNSGMYAALSGNLASMRRLDVLTNNLANANTAGFKKDRLMFESLMTNAKDLTQNVNPGNTPVLSGDRFYTDFSQGPLRQTGNTLDLALEGDGFFVIDTPQGRAYTRQGNFQRDGNGKLVTTDGFEVLGSGPITIASGKVDIDPRGSVVVNGVPVATLQVVDFPKPYALQKIGNAMFVPSDPQATPQPVTNPRVTQGAIEDSNVSTIQEMAYLIETTRFFETCQRVVKSYDDMAGKAANELGRL